MIKLVFPDSLVWQAGIEYGLQSLAGLPFGGWVCDLPNRGPMLEAAAFAIYQLNLTAHVKFQPHLSHFLKRSQIALFPRVASFDQALLMNTLKRGMIVVTSDPSIDFKSSNLFVFPRRDWQTLRDILLRLMTQKDPTTT